MATTRPPVTPARPSVPPAAKKEDAYEEKSEKEEEKSEKEPEEEIMKGAAKPGQVPPSVRGTSQDPDRQ